MGYNNNKYAALSYSDIELIDYLQVLNTSKKSSRTNFDFTKVIISWDTETNPSFINLLQGPYNIYSYAEMGDEMKKEEWNKPKINK